MCVLDNPDLETFELITPEKGAIQSLILTMSPFAKTICKIGFDECLLYHFHENKNIKLTHNIFSVDHLDLLLSSIEVPKSWAGEDFRLAVMAAGAPMPILVLPIFLLNSLSDK